MAETKDHRSDKFIKYIAIIFGLTLVVASVYQIYTIYAENEALKSVDEEITNYDTVKTDLNDFQNEFHDLYMELLALDFEISFKLGDNSINESDAYYMLVRMGRKFWAIQDEFLAYFFEYDTSDPDGITKAFFNPKQAYKYLFDKTHFVEEETLIFNNDTQNWEQKTIAMNRSIVQFTYLEPIVNVSYRKNFAIQELDSKAVNASTFVYANTSKIIFNQTWVDPIDILFRVDVFDNSTQGVRNQQETLSYHVNELGSSLVLNSVALLLLGFLIDVKDKQLWKMIYMVAAIGLALYSLLGQDLFELLAGAI